MNKDVGVAEVSQAYLVEAAERAVPVGYKQTEVGVIPEDWDCLRIGAFNPFVTSGSRGWATFYAPDGDLFVRITNMLRESIYLDLSNVRYVSVGAESSEGKRTSLENNDILISITADIGISSFVDNSLEKPAFINQHIALVRFYDKSVCSKFIAYFLSSHQVQKLFQGSTDQGAKAGMNLDAVRKIKTAIPPLEEQTAIANALSDVDALLSELEKLIAKKQAIKTATMQQLLTGRTRLPQFALREDGSLKGYKQSELGEVPEDWEVKSLGDLVEIYSGESPSKFKFLTSGIPYFKVEQLNNGAVYADSTPYFIDTSKAVIAGSVIFPKRGASILSNKIRVLKEASFMDTNLMALTCSAELNELYLYNQLTYRGLDSVADTTSIPQINNKHIIPFLIPYPSRAEQTAIATILSDMDEEIQALEQRLSKTRQIKQGMMQELLTGRTRLLQRSSGVAGYSH